MRGWKKYKIFILIFFIALCARVFLFSVNLNHTGYDLVGAIHADDGYYEISQGLIQGHGFSGSTALPFKPDSLRPPVWIFIIAFLAKIFGSYWSVFVLELLIGSSIPILGMLIARKITSKKAVWIGTGILLSVEPYGVLLSSLLYSETMFTFLFLIFFIFLIRYFENKSLRNLVWMTVFLGLATLVKPTVQYIPIILVLVMLFEARNNLTKQVVGHAIISLGLFCLVIAPWIYRNHREFGVFGMSAQPAFNLYVYLVPTVLSYDNHTSFKTEVDILLKKDNLDVNSITLSNGDYYQAQALAVLKNHKVALIKSIGTTLVTFFTHDGMLTVFQNAGVVIPVTISKPALVLLLSDPTSFMKTIELYVQGPGSVILLVRCLWILITVLFFIGVVLYLKKEKINTLILMALFLVVYFALTTSINGLGVNARFRVPVNTFIFTFALYGLFSLKKDKMLSLPEKR